MALVTAAVLKTYLPEIQGTAADADLTSLIARVESACAVYLGFPIHKHGSAFKSSLDTQTYTMFYDGPSYGDTKVLNLTVRPVHSITSIHSDPDQVYGSDTLVAASEYTLDETAGKVRLKPTEYTTPFDNSPRAIKVIFSAGYTTANAPEDLIHAICAWCSQLQRAKSSQGRASVSNRGGSISVPNYTMPMEVKQILNPYRNSGSIL